MEMYLLFCPPSLSPLLSPSPSFSSSLPLRKLSQVINSRHLLSWRMSFQLQCKSLSSSSSSRCHWHLLLHASSHCLSPSSCGPFIRHGVLLNYATTHLIICVFFAAFRKFLHAKHFHHFVLAVVLFVLVVVVVAVGCSSNIFACFWHCQVLAAALQR